MTMMKKFVTGSLLAAAPLLAFAQGTSAFTILGVINQIMRIILPMLILAALIYFIYGVVQFVISKDADDKAKAREIVIRGIIGLFVIVSVWGLIGIIQTTFGVGGGGTLDSSLIPNVQT